MRENKKRSPQRRLVATLGALTLGLIAIGGVVAPSASAVDTPVLGDINQSAIGSIVIHKGVQKGGTAQGSPIGTAPVGFQGLAGVQFTAYRITLDLTKTADWTTLNGWATTAPASIADGTACNTLPPTVTGAGVSTTGTTSAPTDGTGLATIGNLAVGAYVVCETFAPNTVVDKAQPFIVSVPYPDTTTGGWLYNPNVFPKNGIGTITKSVTAQAATSLGLGSVASFPVTTTVPSIAAKAQFTHFWIQDPLHPSLTGGTATVTGTGGLTSTMYSAPEPASAANGNTVTVAFNNSGLQWLKTHAGATITTTFTGTVSAVGAIKNVAYLDAATAILDNAPTPTPPNTAPTHDNPGNADNPANGRNLNAPRTSSNEVTTSWGALTIHKVDAVSTTTGLSGAVFEIWDAATPYPATAAACGTGTNGTVPLASFTSAAGVGGVPGLFVSDSVSGGSGFRCYVLKEITAPLGYVLPANASTAVAVTTTAPVGGFNATIPNTQIKGVVLPMTGSNGIVALTIAGVTLIAAGLLLAFLARRRKQSA